MSLLRFSLLATASTLFLAACGGSDSAAPAPPVTPPVVKLSGTAAQGHPVLNATVTVHCAAGTNLSGNTGTAGAWSVTMSGQTFPCLVTVSGGSLPAGRSLHSIALSAANTNVTPLTDLILSSAAGVDLSTLANASAETLTALAGKLAAAQARIFSYLSASGYTLPAGLTAPFTAAFQPTAGDAHDDLIEQITRSLADGGVSYEQLLAAVATAADSVPPIPLTQVLSNAQLGAMPQINKATLTSAGGELSMTLAAGTNDVGSFVGGGAGNKAILQLPSLVGTKLIDFKDMTIELQGDNGSTGIGARPKPYVYLNLFVDLDCNKTPLASGASLGDARARHRIVNFDPFYKFIQQDNAISSSAFNKIKFSPATGGWRVSPGTAVGTGVFVGNEGYSGLETLDGFDFTNYPNACIVDGISGDGGLFRNTAEQTCASSGGLDASKPASCGKAHGGALIVLGDSDSALASTWKIKSIQYNALNLKTFLFE